MSHPVFKPGSDDHERWVFERVDRWLRTRPHDRTRRAFLQHERDAYTLEEGRVTKRDVGHVGGWGLIDRVPDCPDLDYDDLEDTSQDVVPLGAIPEGHHVKGVSTLVSPDGSTRAQWIKTAREQQSREQLLERLLSELPSKVPERDGTIPPPTTPTDDDLLAVYPMGDPHVGMLAWGPEAGEDFDLDIATSIMRAAIDALTSHEPRASRALVVDLGDFLHADTPDNRTTSGRVQVDVDGRLERVAQVGIDVFTYTIDAALRAHDAVDVWVCRGNHDGVASLMIAVALQHHYRQEPRVTVHCNPGKYHYMRFGRVLLGATHGDTVKHGDLESIMATDRSEEWGLTDHRYWLVGHIHHKRQQEYRGCVVESFRTLAAKDAWHAAKGYRSGRDMSRILYHGEWGEIARSTVSSAYLESSMLEAAE